ncbi:transposase [Novipirellula sp. SH528]|uniref:transposase n=1 Tax=Novipirellula sp. SH528 TaxID=3454466 RepID=UPI003FA15C2D
MNGDVPMQDPIAFFITWPTYGTWLPGNQRGWIEYRHGWQLPNRNLEQMCETRMTEKQCLLTFSQRQIVSAQVAETCEFRRWTLHAVDCRSNHAHIVISAANTEPKKIRKDIKAWCTRRLKENSLSTRENWWAERGSIRYVLNYESLATVVEYVTEAQDRKGVET